VTYDPRGVERSERTDGATETTPEEHADDLHRLISTLDAGPVDMFASSGGAVNALALVARHPEQVRTLVAHEPPTAQVLADRDAALAASRDVHETYQRDGLGAGMAKFFAIVSHKGPFPADFVDQPAPDPAMFGLPTEDDGARNDPLLGQNMVSCTHYEPDFDALGAASTRIVMAAGAESDGELAHRGAIAVAERLGVGPVIFPATTVASWGASTASAATRTRSRPRCARSWAPRCDRHLALHQSPRHMTHRRTGRQPSTCVAGSPGRRRPRRDRRRLGIYVQQAAEYACRLAEIPQSASARKIGGSVTSRLSGRSRGRCPSCAYVAFCCSPPCWRWG
jgi:pimeloyl-ACP methyl ester carboxylesterase